MSQQDFRDQEPSWVRYAEMTTNDHDKFYEVRIDLADDGLFYLTKRWGRRPDVGGGQIKIESSGSIGYLMGVADAMMAEKVRKGYRTAKRPYGASNWVEKEYGPDFYAGDEAF